MCRPSKYQNESLAKRSQRLPVHLKVGATVAVHLCTKHLEHQAVLRDDGSGQALARVGITWTVREMPRPRPWAPRPQSGTPVQESALQQTPRASPAVATCDRLTTARFEPLGRAHDKPERQRLVQISLPPGPGPHSGRPWTQSSPAWPVHVPALPPVSSGLEPRLAHVSPALSPALGSSRARPSSPALLSRTTSLAVGPPALGPPLGRARVCTSGRRAAETCGICTRHVLALLFLSPSLSLPPPMPIPSPDGFFPSSFFHPPGCPKCCSKVIS